MRISDWSSDVCSSDLIADDSVSVDDDASRYAEIAHEATDIVQMLGIVPDFLTAVDGVVFNGTMVARLFTHQAAHDQIGSATCRERVCQYVSISVVAVSLKNKTMNKQHQAYINS